MIIALDARPLVTGNITGVEQHARNIVAQWAAMDLPHKFLLLYDPAPAHAAQFDESFIATLPRHFESVPVHGFPTTPEQIPGMRLLYGLARTLRRHEVDIYHSFHSFVPHVGSCPVVQTIHDLSFELDALVRDLPASRAMRKTTRLGARWAARIVTVSTQTKNDITSLYHIPADKVVVVPNGINPVFVPRQDPVLRAQLRQQYPLDGAYLLAVGSDIPRRNYRRMFAAMRAAWAGGADLKYVLAGRNLWPQTPIYKEAQAAGCLDRMVFVRAPADTELAQLYRDATLTCCASSFEGFGLSVLESMACGCPVTCSDMRSLREVAEDTALYFAHDDPQSMSQAILGLVDDAEYRRQLRYRGVARAAHFNWPNAARTVMDVLESTALSAPR